MSLVRGAEIVREAVETHRSLEASRVNSHIQELVGGRYERFISDTVNNHGPMSTPGSYDLKTLELVTNMHDAILERLALEKFDQYDDIPYLSPREAVAGLMAHKTRDEKASFARVDLFEADPPARETKRVTLTFRDQGCGIPAGYIGESIFRIGSQHKNANLWQQGAFGMGATTTYPNAEAVVLVTRRPPSLLKPGDEDVITVAVAEWQQNVKGRGMYYLVTEPLDENPHAQPLTVPAYEVPEFDPGTYLALVNYSTDGFHTGRNDRGSLEFALNTRLWRSLMPVTSMNHIATNDHPKVHEGRGRQFEQNPRDDRRDFHDVIPFRMEGETRQLPVDVFYFEGGASGSKGSIRNFVYRDHSVIFTANGQVHKHWNKLELRRRAEKLTKLYDRILVVVDLDEIPVDQRTQRLFTPDRTELVDTPDAKRLEDTVAAALSEWEELRRLNGELVRKAIQRRTDDRPTLELAKRVEAQMAFRGGFSTRGSGNGVAPRPRVKWSDVRLWPDPTTLEGPIRIRVKPGRTRFVYFHLNARDEFFSSGRGSLLLQCDHPRVGASELVGGRDLRGGMVRVSILVPDDVPVGDTATLTASVRDWMKASGGMGADLEWSCQLEIVGDTDTSNRRNTRGTGGDDSKAGSQVAVKWLRNEDRDGWSGHIPGEVEMIEAGILAEADEYRHLAALGSQPVPTVMLNVEYSPLRAYEASRAKNRSKVAMDQARDSYGVGVAVGLLVLEERYRKLEKEGGARPENTVAERQAVARAALALMPEFDAMARNAGLESENTA